MRVFAVAFAALAAVRGAQWSLSETIQGDAFYDKFDFYHGPDPTNGLVVYQDLDNAKNLNLTEVKDKSFFMRVSTVQKQTEGRPSVRIHSKQTFQDAVLILEASHFPTGCAVWPAFWTVTGAITPTNGSVGWPEGGEIDIAENVNDQYTYNQASIHVAGQCEVGGGPQTGTTVFPQCNYQANQESGCRIAMNGTDTITWGNALNKNGGGLVAMQRDFSNGGKGIRMWFWDKGKQPDELKNPGKTIDPDSWGTPSANFGLTNCKDQFDAHRIVLNIALSGANNWAHVSYPDTPCLKKYQSDAEQVGNHGNSFNRAYWKIENLYIYENGDGSGNEGYNMRSYPTVMLVCTVLASAAVYMLL
ncbi:hypothetical protein MVES1_000286 [Malassezia vespertilionis]|uniref:uncharacterized protein n=1 Tax=Malassezia vespertilionis TaxID=2020962 RepID=UPI0024B14C70|nr:uncharacterized protein MVES1_000286 [Malassezia vespertilionis]WFD04961.1 hypothetical protein MVES1_000286 [Malassezia vespertilionis]